MTDTRPHTGSAAVRNLAQVLYVVTDLLQLALATITRQARRIQALENENARLRLELKMREQRN
jgi:hypothetical protein